MVNFFIQLKQDGSFRQPKEKIYQAIVGSNLILSLDSHKFKNYDAVLLTNFPKKNQKNVLCAPLAPAIKQNIKIIKQNLEKNYSVFKGNYNTEGSWQCEVQLINYLGPLFIQVVFIDQNELVNDFSDGITIKGFGKPEWLVIQPQKILKNYDIYLNQLSMQTVLPYSLGKSNRWIEQLESQWKLGYNAFHFPPLQELGNSGSLYCIKDQLKFNPDIFDSESELLNIIKVLEEKYQCLSFQDILFNHVSCNTEWLKDDSNSYYNSSNTPQLNSALQLDLKLQNFSHQLSNKLIPEYQKGNYIENEQDIDHIIYLLRKYVITQLELEKYFQFDVEKQKQILIQKLQNKGIKIMETEKLVEQDENIFVVSGMNKFRQLIEKYTINLGVDKYLTSLNYDKILEILAQKPSTYSIEGFVQILEEKNHILYCQVLGYIEEALYSIKQTIQYIHITEGKHYVSDKFPLVPNYFSKISENQYAANNGWIMGMKDVRQNFADCDQFYYLRRQIVIWTDLVKLRFGKSKHDSPKLWKQMKLYVQKMAGIFHGFRIDNAHSTPIHVGSYFLRKALKINNNLIVFAELFTGSPEQDAEFVKMMGLNALIQETIHAYNATDLCNTIQYLSKGNEKQVGSLPPLIYKRANKDIMQPLVSLMPKSIVYDQTHDNESLISVHGIRQCLPIIGLNGFGNFFQGTVRGFDELIPDKLSVVYERRLYESAEISEQQIQNNYITVGLSYQGQSSNIREVYVLGSWDNWQQGIYCQKISDNIFLGNIQVSSQGGTYYYKFVVDGVWTYNQRCLQIKDGNNILQIQPLNVQKVEYHNLLYVRKIFNGFTKMLRKNNRNIDIQNHGQGVISILRESNDKTSSYFFITRTAYRESYDNNIHLQIKCPGILKNIKHIFRIQGDQYHTKKEGYITGLNVPTYEEFNLRQYCDYYEDSDTKKTVLVFFNMPPSLTIIMECQQIETEKQAILDLELLLNNLLNQEHINQYQELSPQDINYLLYQCDQEEWNRNSLGIYDLPDQGKYFFAGLASVFTDISNACLNHDQNIPLFVNIRQGNWFIHYQLNRIKKNPRLSRIANTFQKVFDLLEQIPKHNIPYYFVQFIQKFKQGLLKVLNKNEQNHELFKKPFMESLLLASYQFMGENFNSPQQNFQFSIAAGLSHFSVGWARAWGRDTFISLKGLLLIPGLYKEAKQIILMFASVLRHGLIPNLLDNGINPRYNCRDSAWWFIKSIKDYIEFSKDTNILNEEIQMVFLDDDMETHYKLLEKKKVKIMKLQDIIQNIFQNHAKGIRFREWKAGWEIDHNMQNQGFNIELQLDESTGFIYGGNEFNCLTWMDKMGSSTTGGNKGIPATPRCGAPIELTALLKNCLDFVANEPNYAYKSVKTKFDKVLSFKDWSNLIFENFETHFYIHSSENTKCLYRDILYPKQKRWEKQLRCNSSIAIALAPELFTKYLAIQNLQLIEEFLICEDSLGIKTLDPLNENYTSYYDNDDNSTNFNVSHGYSYHNGPEWVWVYGYYLLALYELNKNDEQIKKKQLIAYLTKHKDHIASNEQLSLPEMTNHNGQFNKFSCPSQAWSIAVIMEVCYNTIRTLK